MVSLLDIENRAKKQLEEASQFNFAPGIEEARRVLSMTEQLKQIFNPIQPLNSQIVEVAAKETLSNMDNSVVRTIADSLANNSQKTDFAKQFANNMYTIAQVINQLWPGVDHAFDRYKFDKTVEWEKEKYEKEFPIDKALKEAQAYYYIQKANERPTSSGSSENLKYQLALAEYASGVLNSVIGDIESGKVKNEKDLELRKLWIDSNPLLRASGQTEQIKAAIDRYFIQKYGVPATNTTTQLPAGKATLPLGGLDRKTLYDIVGDMHGTSVSTDESVDPVKQQIGQSLLNRIKTWWKSQVGGE